MPHISSYAALGGMVVVLMTSAACANDTPGPVDSPSTSASTQTQVTTTSTESAPTSTAAATTTSQPAADAVTEDEARQIALDRIGSGQVTDVGQDDEDGRAVWKVKVRQPTAQSTRFP